MSGNTRFKSMKAGSDALKQMKADICWFIETVTSFLPAYCVPSKIFQKVARDFGSFGDTRYFFEVYIDDIGYHDFRIGATNKPYTLYLTDLWTPEATQLIYENLDSVLCAVEGLVTTLGEEELVKFQQRKHNLGVV